MRNISQHAEIVFSGDIARVRQRDQDMFDGSKKRFEAVEKHGSVGVLPIMGDKILLAYQQQPHRAAWYWSLLGGRVPFGVDMLEQAKTELLEESGMRAGSWELLWDASVVGFVYCQKHYYLAKNIEKVAEQSLDPGGEILEVHAVSFDKFIDLLIQEELGNDFLRVKVLKMQLGGTLDAFKEQLFGDVTL